MAFAVQLTVFPRFEVLRTLACKGSLLGFRDQAVSHICPAQGYWIGYRSLPLGTPRCR